MGDRAKLSLVAGSGSWRRGQHRIGDRNNAVSVSRFSEGHPVRRSVSPELGTHAFQWGDALAVIKLHHAMRSERLVRPGTEVYG